MEHVIDVESLEMESFGMESAGFNEQDVDIEQDISLSEITDFKPRDCYTDLGSKGGGQNNSIDNIIKGFKTSTTQCDIDDDAGKSAFVKSVKKEKVSRKRTESESKSEQVPRSSMGDKFLKSFKSEEGGGGAKERAAFSLSDVLKGNEGLSKVNVPQAMAAFAQAAAKVNELPGWPLLPKSLMKKCEKCSKEFCSTVNYRRHTRLHRRSLLNDKELRIERSQLATYWSKLTTEEASRVLSFKNMSIENLSGTSAMEALASFIQQPGLIPFPHAYMKAGSVLLEVVQSKACVFPLSADKLMRVLDDASEGTFLCGGTSVAVQRFIDVEKVGLEHKNVVASMSFLIEETLVKAWMAEKDLEALRCEKALVEEEEAAQRKRAKILEKKQQRRTRQKGHKEPDHVAANVSGGEMDKEDYPLPSGASLSSGLSSEHDLDEGQVEDGFASIECGIADRQGEPDKELELDCEVMDNGNSEAFDGTQEQEQEPSDQQIGKAMKDRRRSGFYTTSSFRSRMDGVDSTYYRSRRSQHSIRGDTRRKLNGVYRGIVKGTTARVVWTRKVSKPEDAEAPKGSLLVGSLSVPLGEFARPQVEAKQPTTGPVHAKLPPVKVWKAVSRGGEQAGNESARSTGSEKSTIESEQAFPPKLHVAVGTPSQDLEECTVDCGATLSPTAELLANFLSERWATAVQRNQALMKLKRERSHRKSRPTKEETGYKARNVVRNSCGKLWQSSTSKEQRYMPRRQISTA